MKIFCYEDFLVDLRNHGDARFAKRVLNKVLNSNGSFRSDSADHRYDGIDNAWIRYVSGQNTAWRAIYIRRGEEIFLYRCGEHSVENNLAAPHKHAEVIELVSSGVMASGATPSDTTLATTETSNRFLQNSRGNLLKNFLTGRRLVPHKEIILISPIVSSDLLQRTGKFGRILDQLIEDGTVVTLATRWPSFDDLSKFEDLDARGFRLLFHPRLRANLYIFEVRTREYAYNDNKFENVAIVGSANLTSEALGFSGAPNDEELCYELRAADFNNSLEFASQIALDASDLREVRRQYATKKGGVS
jgi:hypothetical protein